jgi:subtilisin family serine protease
MMPNRLSFLAPLALLMVWALPATAQTPIDDLPDDWQHLDLERDGFVGMSTYRAYEELLADRTPRRRVVVAVIDSGIDTSHTALHGRMWTNSREVAGSGRDDDGNGYVDDVFGWSFLGNPAGENVEYDTYEYAREYARLRPRFEGANRESVDDANRADYEHLAAMRDSLDAKRAEFAEYAAMIGMASEAMQSAHTTLSRHFGSVAYTDAQLDALHSGNAVVLQARDLMMYLRANDLTPDGLAEQDDYVRRMLDYNLNPDFDPRHIVGDDYQDVTERFYGSPDVHGPDPSHGTGVAGAIAGRWDSGMGTFGVASDSVFVMAIRAVPQGDERDKDVANAIRYAVDNGAHVVNMSFGKPVSPRKDAVDEAVRYAMERGVLLVHAAGNDGYDLLTTTSYPSRFYEDGDEAALWIEVGASGALPDALVASFSNYGRGMVDVFAPGEDVRVLAPGDGTDVASGTSFASPHVAGLAALLLSHYPALSAADVRQIILDSATLLADVEVIRPGTFEVVLPFGSLSTTGGVINVYEAVRLAEQRHSAP